MKASMTPKYPGSDLAEFRAQTERQKQMPGVTSPSFICKQCQQSRRTAGRKKTAEGWRCAACYQTAGYRKTMGAAA